MRGCSRTSSLLTPSPYHGYYIALRGKEQTAPSGVAVDERADVLALEGGLDPLGGAAVDELEAVEEAGVGEEVEEDGLEGEGREASPAQGGHGDLGDEARGGIELWVGVVEAVDVLDQGEALAAEALGEQEGAGVGAVRGDAADARRVLPERVGRHAAEHDTRRALQEEG